MSTPEQDQKIISLYLSGKTTYEVADELNHSQSFVMDALKKNNIPRRSTYSYTTKYVANEKFFDIIDTEEKAYFLGLMYADGNNYIRGVHSYEVSIKLQECDKIILEKFRDLISPQSQVKICPDKSTPNTHYMLKINSKTLSDQLSNLGCIPNKSLILKFPDFLQEHLIQHFIRGYSDGDGSIYCKKPNKSNYIDYMWQLTSTKDFCIKAKQIIEGNLNIHFTPTLAHPKTNQITTTIKVGGNLQVKKALDWLYKDATIYLPRKYDKYQEFLQYFEIRLNN